MNPNFADGLPEISISIVGRKKPRIGQSEMTEAGLHLMGDRCLRRCERSLPLEEFLGLLALEILLSVSVALALLIASGAGG